MRETKGALGLPFVRVGETVQSLAATLVDRGFNEAKVRSRLLEWANNGEEQGWWDNVGGPLVDDLARDLGFEDPYPSSEDEG